MYTHIFKYVIFSNKTIIFNHAECTEILIIFYFHKLKILQSNSKIRNKEPVLRLHFLLNYNNISYKIFSWYF